MSQLPVSSNPLDILPPSQIQAMGTPTEKINPQVHEKVSIVPNTAAIASQDIFKTPPKRKIPVDHSREKAISALRAKASSNRNRRKKIKQEITKKILEEEKKETIDAVDAVVAAEAQPPIVEEPISQGHLYLSSDHPSIENEPTDPIPKPLTNPIPQENTTHISDGATRDPMESFFNNMERFIGLYEKLKPVPAPIPKPPPTPVPESPQPARRRRSAPRRVRTPPPEIVEPSNPPPARRDPPMRSDNGFSHYF
mgnify:FL=1